ncbi:hypothetical protein J5N97_028095 [Dioscorea zingiberensis]|uniref:Uncharacterized protein n=1 Tax=Dioscorea zingiberensis TaxID=325984 RepID=A0A9D5H4I3_9LILI|nr:hypothetical protein J5N97_028095 [Dioscorea zingiberensis]
MEESKCKILRSYSDELALKEVDKIELISKCENLEKEVEKYKGIGATFEEQMTKMYEECRTMRTRERMAQERILCAMDEIDEWKRKCENLEARVVELMLENKVMYEWKSKCGVLEIRMSELMEENSRLKSLHCDNVIVISDGEDDGVKIDVKEGRNSERKGEVLITKQRSLNVMVNDDGCRKEERFLSTSTPKRKCSSRVITSDIEDDDGDDDDDTPIGKLKMRKKAKEYDDEDEIPIGELLSGKHTVDGDEVREDVTPCRRRLFPLREYDKMNSKKKWSDRDKTATSKMDRISRNKGNVSRKVGLLDEDDAKEGEEDRIHEVNVGDSDSGSGSLRGFIVNDSEVDENKCSYDDDDDSSSNSLSDLDLGEVLARFRREKHKKEWEYEADMLASFSKNPELCMKAVCAIYRQQTSEEQTVKGSLLTNNRGFNKLDANKGSRIAEFLLDGDPTGPLKKSLEELQKYDPYGLDYCLKLARHYSKQLFMIYQNKEDPFFLPS